MVGAATLPPKAGPAALPRPHGSQMPRGGGSCSASAGLGLGLGQGQLMLLRLRGGRKLCSLDLRL